MSVRRTTARCMRAGGEAEAVLAAPGRPGRDDWLTHLESVPPRWRQTCDWPRWVPDEVLGQLRDAGIDGTLDAPGRRGRSGARRAARRRRDRDRIGQVARLPAAGLPPSSSSQAAAPQRRRLGALLSPDQGARPGPAARGLVVHWCPACGSTTLRRGLRRASERDWARDHASTCSPTPTCCTARCCRATQRWARFLGCLQSSWSTSATTTAACSAPTSPSVLRRLRRVCAQYGAASDVRAAPRRLSPSRRYHARADRPAVVAVVEDGSPRGGIAFASVGAAADRTAGENGAPVRRSALAEAADLLSRPGRRRVSGRSRSSGRGAVPSRSR